MSNTWLLLGRHTMTNLDGMLKSRVITLPTKVPIIKAVAFPVVMYGCESWIKAEHRRTGAFELEKTLMLGKTEGRRRRRQQRMRWLNSITYSMDMNLSKLQETVEDRGDWCTAVHGVAKSWTRLSNWTTRVDYLV